MCQECVTLVFAEPTPHPKGFAGLKRALTAQVKDGATVTVALGRFGPAPSC